MSSQTSLVIGRTHAIQYRMPLKRPFGTSRYVTKATTNFLVRVHGDLNDQHIMGVGEAQPRNKLTGDLTISKAWNFFSEATESLQGAELAITSPENAVASIRGIMRELRVLAQRHSTGANREKPFRGSLLGLEIALLDVAAQALGISIAELLGGIEREEVVVTASTISTENTVDELSKKITRQAKKYPMNRVKGHGDLTKDLEALKAIHAANLAASDPKQVWMDINEGFNADESKTFIAKLVEGISRGELPELITLEQPIPKVFGDHLPELQREADALTAASGTGDIRIMPDESMWDIENLEHLHGLGGCRAINIKTAKAGGLIASLDTARRAVELNPDTYVYIGGMIGTSDLTTWAIHQLVKALPRIDYLTAMPPGNVVTRISQPLAKFRKGTNVHRKSERAGLGAALMYNALVPYIVKHSWFPEPKTSSLLAGTNVYPVKHLRGFTEKQVDSHVIEREALALGADTVRTSPVDFVVVDRRRRELAFSWTKSILSSTAAVGITADKQTTRDLLRDAGVPAPKGRRFDLSNADDAVSFAEDIGYPVVFKPLRGTGGQSVMPGITSSTELRHAFLQEQGSRISRPGVVVEEHIEGREFRIFTMRDKALSAVEKRPGQVEGDGELTIAELMHQKHSARMHNPHLRLRRIKFDEKNLVQLRRQGLSFDTVLPEGKIATYTLSPSFHLGGESVEMLKELHPSITDAATEAVRAIPSLAYAGVDFIISDPALPLDQQRAGVLELNAHPAQSSHEFPMRGDRSRVSREMLRFVAEHAGFELGQVSREELNLRLLVRGRFRRSQDALQWLAEKAINRNLSGWTRAWGRGLLESEISGSTDEASSLISALMRPTSGMVAGSVEATHLRHSHSGEFEVFTS